ncbi:hypothetical protein J6590_055263 [Homalodisca vitripennis]|nr:hypothetical protein J6590_055263 [Homalodisca vitripennis]
MPSVVRRAVKTIVGSSSRKPNVQGEASVNPYKSAKVEPQGKRTCPVLNKSIRSSQIPSPVTNESSAV